MSFYTNVCRYGNTVLYRGYNHEAKRIYKRDNEFKPVFFVPSKEESQWKSLDGHNIAPIQMDNMRHAKEWLTANKNVAGREVYGNHKYLQQYITQKFPRDIKFRREFIDVGTPTVDERVSVFTGIPSPNQPNLYLPLPGYNIAVSRVTVIPEQIVS